MNAHFPTRTIAFALGLFAAVLVQGQVLNYPNGSTVPDFTVTDVNGVNHNLSTYTGQGKHVMIEFFGSNSTNPQQWNPIFNELFVTYGCNRADLICLAINSGVDNTAAVLQFDSLYGGTFDPAPAVSNQGGATSVANSFGVGSYPTFCLIGPGNEMIANDIWPIQNINTLTNAFPSGSSIQTSACDVGIPERDAARIAEVFPVPSTGLVSVSTENRTGNTLSLLVFDQVGRTVHAEKLIGSGGLSTSVIDLSALCSGRYVLELRANGRITDVRPVVIAH
jgi:hypothetical protein